MDCLQTLQANFPTISGWYFRQSEAFDSDDQAKAFVSYVGKKNEQKKFRLYAPFKSWEQFLDQYQPSLYEHHPAVQTAFMNLSKRDVLVSSTLIWKGSGVS